VIDVIDISAEPDATDVWLLSQLLRRELAPLVIANPTAALSTTGSDLHRFLLRVATGANPN
jgi:hypothetical protein